MPWVTRMSDLILAALAVMPQTADGGWNEVGGVGGGVVEGDLAPGVERGAQRLTPFGRVARICGPSLRMSRPSLRAKHHRLERDAVGSGAGLDAHRVTDRAAAELQHDVFAEIVEQLVHLPGMDAARRHRHDLVQRRPVLLEEKAVLRLSRGVGARAACRRSP